MSEAKAGHVAYCVATWVFIGHDRGRNIADDAIRDACDRLNGAQDPDAAGQALAGLIADRTDGSVESVRALAAGLFGEVDTNMGGSRDERLRSARRYQFKTQLPWLACIIDRFPDGSVGPHWVLVEQVSDVVRVMDPYPWDDLDEEQDVPVTDFLVKWELAGGAGIRL